MNNHKFSKRSINKNRLNLHQVVFRCLIFESVFSIGQAIVPFYPIDRSSEFKEAFNIPVGYIPLNSYWILTSINRDLGNFIDYFGQRLEINDKYKNIIYPRVAHDPLISFLKLVKLNNPLNGDYYSFKNLERRQAKIVFFNVDQKAVGTNIGIMPLDDNKLVFDYTPSQFSDRTLYEALATKEDLGSPVFYRSSNNNFQPLGIVIGSNEAQQNNIPSKKDNFTVEYPNQKIRDWMNYVILSDALGDLPDHLLNISLPPESQNTKRPLPPIPPKIPVVKPSPETSNNSISTPPPMPPRDPISKPSGSTFKPSSNLSSSVLSDLKLGNTNLKSTPPSSPIVKPLSSRDQMLSNINASKYLVVSNKSLEKEFQYSHMGWFVYELSDEEKGYLLSNKYSLLIPEKASYWLLKENIRKKVDDQKKEVLQTHVFHKIILPESNKEIMVKTLKGEAFKVKENTHLFEIENLKGISTKILKKGRQVDNLAVYPVKNWIKSDVMDFILGPDPYRNLLKEKTVYEALETSSFKLMTALIKHAGYESLLKVQSGCILLAINDAIWESLAVSLNCKSNFTDYPIYKLQKLLEKFIIFTDRLQNKKEKLTAIQTALSGTKYEIKDNQIYNINTSEELVDINFCKLKETDNGVLIPLEKYSLSSEEIEKNKILTRVPTLELQRQQSNPNLIDLLNESMEKRRLHVEDEEEDDDSEWED